MRSILNHALCYALLVGGALAQGVVSTPKVTITVSTNGVVEIQTSGTVVTNPPPPSPLELVPQRPIIPMSHTMRLAAQLARGKAAPWNQRFIVTDVKESALTRTDDDGSAPVFSTNYTVTIMPVTDETNAPVAWGAIKSKAIKFVTPRPTKKGDEFELFPTAL